MLLALCDSMWSQSVDILCFQRADRFRSMIRQREHDLLAGSAGFLQGIMQKFRQEKRSSL